MRARDRNVWCVGVNGEPAYLSFATCGSGRELNATTLACQACSLGRASNDPAECVTCTPGRFANATGGSVCAPCVPGWFQPANGATRCLSCGPGSFSDAASPGCTVCQRGTVAPRNLSSACLSCPQPSVEADKVLCECPPGTFGELDTRSPLSSWLKPQTDLTCMH
jgi:hypothetical protein